MLKDKTSSAIVAVSDLERARDFYGNTLGLRQREDGMADVLAYRTGETTLVVYRSEGIRPGTGNAVAWDGGKDVEAIADALRANGVTLEEYPDLGMQVERGLHTGDGFVGIWFKDPHGNILHVHGM